MESTGARGWRQAVAVGCIASAVTGLLLVAGVWLLSRRGPPPDSLAPGSHAAPPPTVSEATAPPVAPTSASPRGEGAPATASGTATQGAASKATVTHQPSPVAPTPLTNAAPGTVVVCADAAGDVANDLGSIPEIKLPGTDLSRVELALGMEQITVTFTATERLPIDAGPSPLGGEASILWYVLTRSGDESAYLLQVELFGSHWFMDAQDLVAARWAGVTERPARNRRFAPPVARDRTLVAAFPLAELPGLSAPLTWTAGTEWGDFDVYGDACPDRTAGQPRHPSSRLIAPGRLP